MIRHLVLFALLAALLGCSAGKRPKKEPIAIEQIPEMVMKVAKKELPGVEFTRAVITADGDYEILGKDAKGKTKEIYISPAGVVTGRE